MIPTMKTSAFDTFCRALVLGAVLGAVGWGAIRYTNLPQMALEKIVTLSREVQGHADNNTNYLHDASVTLKTPASVSALNSNSIPVLPGTPSSPQSSQNIPAVNLGVLQQQEAQHTAHQTQQAAYLEPTPPNTNNETPTHQISTSRKTMEQRLCELGAVYSLLEMWGHENVQYRFHCRVSIASNRQVTRSFEANGGSPEEAMWHVLAEVEGFQSTSSLQGPEVR